MDGLDNDEPFVFRLNDNGSGPSLLVKVCAERGWRMYHGYNSNEERWNLWWRTSSFPAGYYKTLGDWQFMNHIPKGGSICRKDSLSRLLRCMRRVYGSIYEFSPPSYHLPLEYAKLVSECSRLRRAEDGDSDVIWIHKPVAQSQGRGIFLFRSVCEMRCGASAVVQRYIERPLLIAGYKFDLRLYVCVPGYRPLTAYMYAEGLARFGTDKYTVTDIHNPYRHLTNSSLNKSGPRFAECKDRIGSGCKWTLKQVRRALVGRWGAAEWLVWQRIRALVTLTLLAQAAGTPPTRNCFEFYGFDVLLDNCLKPWLIEVNLSPALGANCEADITVKQPMLHELFDLLGMPMRHTGLALLSGPSQIHHYNSEDEGGAARAVPARAVTAGAGAGAVSSAGGRRGVRWRRRRPMPLHCVTLLPPVPDYTDMTDKPKEINSGRSSKTPSEVTVDNSDVQVWADRKYLAKRAASAARQSATATGGGPSNAPPISEIDRRIVSIMGEGFGSQQVEGRVPAFYPSTSSVTASPEMEESCRSSTATATRRKIMRACSWGNGVRWDRAAGRVGDWVRIYPHALPGEDQMPVEDIRDSVAQVSKFLRAAREVYREGGRDSRAPRDAARDAAFQAALHKKLDCPHFQVWLPPF